MNKHPSRSVPPNDPNKTERQAFRLSKEYKELLLAAAKADNRKVGDWIRVQLEKILIQKKQKK
jgi:uncharacterized protein (DUF1778 family)